MANTEESGPELIGNNAESAPAVSHSGGVIETLRAKHLLTDDQIKIVRYELSRASETVAHVLTRLGFVSEASLRQAMSETLGQESVDLSTHTIDPEALALVPKSLAQRHTLLPLSWTAQTRTLILAVADSSDLLAQDKLAQILPPNTHLDMRLAGMSEINRAIDRAYGYTLDIDGILHEIETGEVDFSALENDRSYSQPTVRLIDAVVTDAVKRDASDIHFEPEGEFLRVRYRIDGVLRQVRILHQSYWPAMVVRIKVISQMNIAEIRSPQDGRMSMMVRGHPVDFRVSVFPTVHGENVVLRILDRDTRDLSLDHLGANAHHRDLLEQLMARPEGVIVVTGPTGSGKTTTLYAMLQHINKESINIVTLEDPVEYPLAMVRQTSVSESTKVDYAEGIRALLRQDPDVILVGEVRDADTASMTFRAAMTGHQVYTTLHTNSALGVFPRLMDMGLSSQVLTGNIIGVVAQRLIRVLCAHCKTPATIPDTIRAHFPPSHRDGEVFGAVGCPRCEFTGYHGRQAIFEIVRINEALDMAIAQAKSVFEMRHIALADGFQPLAYNGLEKIAQGLTTLEEVARNTDLTFLR